MDLITIDPAVPEQRVTTPRFSPFMPIKTFTGWQWLLIDAATQYGLDKRTFEERLAWSEEHLSCLEAMIETSAPKERPLFIKAVMAIRACQRGEPIGHLMGLDASASGIQIMSALTGCEVGAWSTGLVDPDRRADVYSSMTDAMNNFLLANDLKSVTISRAQAKDALMTAFYGSKKVPKTHFGEGTAELAAFYEAAVTVAPGPWALLQQLIQSWGPKAQIHSWTMPDGFEARVKVMIDKTARIEIDELGTKGSSFSYAYSTQGTKPKAVTNAANVVHSIDAYLVRCMHRRCNYDQAAIERARALIQIELMHRLMGLADEDRILAVPFANGLPATWNIDLDKAAVRIRNYRGMRWLFQIPDGLVLPDLTEENVRWLATAELQELAVIASQMLSHPPFELVTIHDEFRCHPNNVDQVRRHYRELLAMLAEGRVVDAILDQLNVKKRSEKGGTGAQAEAFTSVKVSEMLSPVIRQSNYALC